ncbi:hypothetical protein V1358_12260 [Pseudoalteromonas sp. YIC-656]|uniref:hypothetical protein n=1 Tax=Pseudoalteromonas pernae TaxID=3118054 RepID=UPI003242C1DD
MFNGLKSIAIALSVTVVSGCQLTPTSGSTNAADEPVRSAPNPKPRPKIAPLYPTATELVQWHAQQCGGFTSVNETKEFVGAPRLKQFFARLCLRGQTNPQELLAELDVISGQYYWPESSARYFWLLKQQLQANAQLQQSLAVQQDEQKQMQEKMQQTLSSLAAIEQQLLQRASQPQENNDEF